MEENNSKQISLVDFWKLIKSHIILVIVITLLSTIIGGIYTFCFKKTKYTASLDLQIVVSAESTVQAGQPNGLSEQTRYSYSTYLAENIKDFITSYEFVKYAKDKGVNINPSALKFSHEEYSVIVHVTYTVKSKSDIRKKVADNLSDYFKCCIDKLDNSTEDSWFKDRIKILSDSNENNVTASRGGLITMAIFFGAGLVLSLLIVLIMYMADDTFKSKEDVEQVTGTNVLTIVGVFTNDDYKSTSDFAKMKNVEGGNK